MPINFDNANYKMFTDFAATAAKQTTRAALGTLNAPDGTARTVKASSQRDFIGNVWRLSAKRADNDAVRDLFRQTIIDMFGGENRIPKSVKDAMKLQDYGKGKPLTARRIALVKAAVDQVSANAKRYGDKAIVSLVNCNVDKREGMAEGGFAALSKTVRDAIASCGDDVDAMETIADSVFDICVAGNNDLRGEEAIRAKIDRIKANYRELREVAAGNGALYGIGKVAIMNLKGGSFPAGAFRALAEAAGKADVSFIKRLKGNTGPVTINRAMLQFFRNFDEVARKTGLMDAFKDTTMLAGARNIAWAIMLGKLGHGKLREIRAALSGDNAAELNTLLQAGGQDWFGRVELDEQALNEAISGDPGKEPPEDIKERIRDNMDRMVTAGFSAVHAVIGLILGEEPQEVPDRDDLVPANYKMILEDYAQEAKRQLGLE